MRFYHCILAFILFHSVLAGYNNVTSFWQNMLKESDMHFQAYTGNHFFTQVMKKLTGITQKIKVECITVYLVLQVINLVIMNLQMEFHLSFGSKVVLEEALNMELFNNLGQSELRMKQSDYIMHHGISLAICYSLINH